MLGNPREPRDTQVMSRQPARAQGELGTLTEEEAVHKSDIVMGAVASGGTPGLTELSGATDKRRPRKRMERDVAELNPEAQSRGGEEPQGLCMWGSARECQLRRGPNRNHRDAFLAEKFDNAGRH